jgi:membrane protease YdiL (CAAX protease family)
MARWSEFLFIFGVLPVAFRFRLIPLSPIPALWVVAIYCVYRLWSDPEFDRRKLWNAGAFPPQARPIFLLFAVCALGVTVCVYFFGRPLLFNFVRRDPVFWALLMLLYPMFSVYPQGVVYRAFLFQRYRELLPNRYARIAVSAAAFSFVHIIFRNVIAVVLTLIGGVIFALRYAESDSLFTSALEHALYGCWMFTVGLGDFFYKGAR